MWFKFFHKHSWSTPHPDEKRGGGTYIMRCYECGAIREVQTELAASLEVEKRIEQAKETLQKVIKAS
ncbi:MAG: hypothetical protein JNN15_11965 [Blastocatellia bacterium]|nr:hypothetical protein [Blastocatellia bacterium]